MAAPIPDDPFKGLPVKPTASGNRDPVAREIHLRAAAEGMREVLRRAGGIRDEDRQRLDEIERRSKFVNVARLQAEVTQLRAELAQMRVDIEQLRGPRRRTLTAHLASGPLTIHSVDEPR
jgi:hypothetical protein